MSLAEPKLNFRSLLVIFLALSVSLPIAFLSLAKVLVFLTALAYLSRDILLKRPALLLAGLHTGHIIILAVFLWSASLIWTGANLEDALVAFVKHGKLMLIPLLVYLLRNQFEAKWSVFAFLTGQTLVIFSSWLMAFGVSLPWVMRPSGQAHYLTQFVPYADSYLDQSTMLATTAGVLWFLGYSHRSWKSWTKLLALAALVNVLMLMTGRTGYLLAIVAVCLIALFEIPIKLRLFAAVIVPLILGLTLFYTLPQFEQRVTLAAKELTSYGTNPDVRSSVGARLNMWNLSLQAIAEKPWAGHGVGNWTPVVKNLYGTGATAVLGAGNGSNPHQELLLWTVELGASGCLLFLGLLYALYLDTKTFKPKIRRSALYVATMLLVTCMFNSPLYDDLIGDYFCIALGLLLALGLQENEEKSRSLPGLQVTN